VTENEAYADFSACKHIIIIVSIYSDTPITLLCRAEIDPDQIETDKEKAGE
jgi:hypothetical protein